MKEGRNILHTTKRRKGSWIGHILRRNIIEVNMEVTGIQGIRRKQLLDEIK